jgi:hypothetical protein|nr:MAG TPA: Protein of unknown function (DUF2089) [Caudoviricetes sp.]
MFRLTPLQVSDDLRNENCIIVDGFYVYRDKIVQFTRHFGYTVNKGTYDQRRGYIVMRNSDNKRFAVSHLKAKAFLAEGRPIYSISFKDGNNKNTDLDNLIVKYKKESRHCKDCETLLGPNSKGNVCLKCKQKLSEQDICSKQELKERKDRMKYVDLNSLDPVRKNRAELYLEGHTLEYIANQYGVSRQAISYNLQQIIKSGSKKNNIKAELNMYQLENERLKKEIASLSELVNKYIKNNEDIQSKVDTLISLAKDLNQENLRLKNFVKKHNKKLTMTNF